MWLLDEGTTEPQYPTIGFKFCEQKECSTLCKCNRMNIVEYMGQLVSTMMDVYDKGYIAHSQGDLQRSIQIPVHITVNGTDQKIRTTDFAITSEESQALFQRSKCGNGIFASDGIFMNGNRSIDFQRKIKPTDKLCRFYFLMMVMMSVFAYFKAVCNCEVSAFVNAVLFIVCHVTYY